MADPLECAARIDDPIEHTGAMLGAVLGAIAGIIVGVAIVVAFAFSAITHKYYTAEMKVGEPEEPPELT